MKCIFWQFCKNLYIPNPLHSYTFWLAGIYVAGILEAKHIKFIVFLVSLHHYYTFICCEYLKVKRFKHSYDVCLAKHLTVLTILYWLLNYLVMALMIILQWLLVMSSAVCNAEPYLPWLDYSGEKGTAGVCSRSLVFFYLYE